MAGIPEIMIGETLADPDDPRPLPLITVDEPAISMTIGVNTSPLVGREKGSKVTARMVRDRLDRELVGNVSLRVLPTDRPDTWEVQGRGELAWRCWWRPCAGKATSSPSAVPPWSPARSTASCTSR